MRVSQTISLTGLVRTASCTEAAFISPAIQMAPVALTTTTSTHEDGVPVAEVAAKSVNGTEPQRKVLPDDYYRSKFSVMAKNRAHDGSECRTGSHWLNDTDCSTSPSPSSWRSSSGVKPRNHLSARRKTTRIHFPLHLHQLRSARPGRSGQRDPHAALAGRAGTRTAVLTDAWHTRPR